VTTALIILAAALAAVAVALTAALVARAGSSRGVLRGRTVTVQTRRPDDQTIRGTLLHEYGDRLTLTDATYLNGRSETPIGGLVHVPAANVAWLQEHEG
jgi:hypothetical protein